MLDVQELIHVIKLFKDLGFCFFFFYLYICSELKRKYKSGLSLSTNKAAGFIMYWDFIEFVFAANRRGDKTTAGNSHRNADLTHY